MKSLSVSLSDRGPKRLVRNRNRDLISPPAFKPVSRVDGTYSLITVNSLGGIYTGTRTASRKLIGVMVSERRVPPLYTPHAAVEQRGRYIHRYSSTVGVCNDDGILSTVPYR